VVREWSAKNKKEERVYLVPETVEALRFHRPSDFTPDTLVFPNGIPRASRLRADAERNGIQYRDELGRYADFHALRYTCATWMQRNGVPARFAMKQMRHSDIKLTVKVYTDELQLPVYDAIKDFRGLGGIHKYAHRFQAQRGKTGRSLSRRGKGAKRRKPL